MTMITPELLHKIAHLARLDVRPEEETSMLGSLNDVLTWMEQLNEVDTEGVEPLTHISLENNVLRTDVVANQLPREQALVNAPQQDSQFFEVPKVLE